MIHEENTVALDPELAIFLNAPFPNNFDDLEWSRREQARLSATMSSTVDGGGATWEDLTIPANASGDELPIRIYHPTAPNSPRGALLFFHGGAFVFGDLDSEHARCLLYCDAAQCVVVSVGYSLAPEHPFPTAFAESVQALRWLAENAPTLDIDPARIGVAGVSAGGAIASGLVLHARDTGGPSICAQLLVYPVTDSNVDTPSISKFFHAEPFDGERVQRMWALYLPRELELVPAYASVARASELTNLPPTYIVTADLDPLRDEGLAYARALIDAGNDVELHHFPGTYHGFDAVAPQARLSRRALGEQCAFLTEKLGDPNL